MMRWPWGNSTPPSFFRTISGSSWSVRRSTTATAPIRRARRAQRSRRACFFRSLWNCFLIWVIFCADWTGSDFQAGLRAIDDELVPEMHRTISGDLQNEEEMDRAMEAGEEGIYHVKALKCEQCPAPARQHHLTTRTCICSDLTVCSDTVWTSSPPIQPTSTRSTWPTSGRSSSPTANPKLIFSPRRHQKTTATTTPSPSESKHVLTEDEDLSDDRWAFLFLCFSGCHLRERAARENFIIRLKTQRQVWQWVQLKSAGFTFKCLFTCPSLKYKCLHHVSVQTTHPPGISRWGRTEHR